MIIFFFDFPISCFFQILIYHVVSQKKKKNKKILKILPDKS